MQCIKCCLVKDKNQFAVDKARKNKKHPVCKNCKSNYDKLRYQEKRDLYIKKAAEWYSKNKESSALISRRWRANNPEKAKEVSTEYAKRNPEVGASRARRRRARKNSAITEKYTEIQLIEFYGSNCHICKTPIDLLAPRKTGKPNWEIGLHIDHLVPISKGGNDTIENVRPSHGLCNVKRGAR
jgi:5-methylcytosine-specific restriction endonuclease McrA